ncbi:MAG: heme ABC transporter permease [Hyphomicrobiales bacterium]
MIRFANPTRFLALASRLIPFLAVASTVLLAAGVYGAFFVAPADYQQGETVRIMYVHVPSAWLSMGCYSLMALSALGTLIWRHPLADVSAKALLPIGMAFTFICLVTGSFWGRPMWGAWWVWDARLTSVLILFLMYCGVMALWNAFEDPARAGRAVAIMTLAGAINIPIIKFSVDWWNTLHQPASVFRIDGPSIHPTMLWPLLVMTSGFLLLTIALQLNGMRTEILRRRIRTLSLMATQPDVSRGHLHG